MSLFLPLLLAGALVSSSAPNTNADDKSPRTRRAVIDTTAHRQLASDLIVRAHRDAEAGEMNAARAELLTANTMMRESGGLDEASVYSLVHIDFALERYAEAADLLNEYSDQSVKAGNATAAATAMADAAELYNLGELHSQAANAVTRFRALLADRRIADSDRAALRKRLG